MCCCHDGKSTEPSFCDNSFNISLLNAVLPIFKRHLLDSISSSFLLMSWGSKGRPIVFRFSFYNHTWIQSICIPVPCSFTLSVGRSQAVCDVNLSAHAHTNMQRCKTPALARSHANDTSGMHLEEMIEGLCFEPAVWAIWGKMVISI